MHKCLVVCLCIVRRAYTRTDCFSNHLEWYHTPLVSCWSWGVDSAPQEKPPPLGCSSGLCLRPENLRLCWRPQVRGRRRVPCNAGGDPLQGYWDKTMPRIHVWYPAFARARPVGWDTGVLFAWRWAHPIRFLKVRPSLASSIMLCFFAEGRMGEKIAGAHFSPCKQEHNNFMSCWCQVWRPERHTSTLATNMFKWIPSGCCSAPTLWDFENRNL
jgi:hypothetical protein